MSPLSSGSSRIHSLVITNSRDGLPASADTERRDDINDIFRSHSGLAVPLILSRLRDRGTLSLRLERSLEDVVFVE